MDQWYCAIDGNRFGPIDEETLKAWIKQGRVSSSDLVWREGMANWQSAQSVPELADAFTMVAAAPPLQQAAATGVSQYLRPHRGAAVLTLGILGITPCCICGIIAWSMGNNDLRDMNAGHMDPSGRGLTTAGRICGMVGVCIWGAYALMYLFMILLFGGLMCAGAPT